MFQQSASAIIKRVCPDCTGQSFPGHYDNSVMFYRRKTDPSNFEPYAYMLESWTIENNRKGEDFDIFRTYQDALNDALSGRGVNAYKACTFDHAGEGIAFPGNCGAYGEVPNTWIPGPSYSRPADSLEPEPPESVAFIVDGGCVIN